MRVASGTGRRACVLLAIAAAAVLGVAAPAAASVPPPPVDTQHGQVGVHSLTDTEASPAATCVYGVTVDGTYEDFLHRIVARPPVAFANHGKTSQRIQWRLVVSGWVVSTSTWRKVAKTSWVTASATPTAAASFRKEGLAVDSIDHFATLDPYEARNDLRWLAPNGSTVVGTARLFPHWYLAHENGNADFDWNDTCGDTTG